MADILKKDMLRLWAETGDIVAPSDSKISDGWAVEVVPRQWWNWMQNRVDTNVAYMLQKGIPEWDGLTEYVSGKSYVQHNGTIYKSIQTGSNQNPATATTYWQKALVESSASMEAIKAVTPSADTFAYFTGATTAASTGLTAFARTLLDDADATTARTTLGAQTLNTALTAISGVAPTANTFAYFSGTTTAASTSLTSYARTLLDDLDATAARNTLGLGSIAVQDASTVAITGGSISGITDLAIADGGTGASDAAGARTNLGLANSATIAATNANTGNTIVQRDASGNFSAGTITATLFGNATTATTATTANALTTGRTISLAGDVTGSVSFNGSANVSITATVADDSHNHIISNVDGLQTALDLRVLKDSNTGSAALPSGTTAQRSVSPVTGALRFNSTLTQFEGYNGTAWGTVGGGATGAPGNYVFNLNDQYVTGDYTIPTGKNAVTGGPIIVNDGVTITVSDGSTWTVV